MKCPECKGEMKPLFQSFYCPKECDLPAEKRAKVVENKPEVMGLSDFIPSLYNWTDGLGSGLNTKSWADVQKYISTPKIWVTYIPFKDK